MIPLRDNIPTETYPFVTIFLIVTNILVFMWELGFGLNRAAFIYGFIPVEFFYRVELTPAHAISPSISILTSMFIHGGFLHIIGNMLFLWIFGNNVEDTLGHLRFLVFYLACGVAAALCHGILDPSSRLPMVGASGAISGVLAAYLMRYPYARIDTLIFFFFFVTVIPIPAFFYIVFWFVVQLLNGLFSYGLGVVGGVAWFAHVGGFLAGVILYKLFPKRA